jgi:hypothetical protein
MGRGMGWKDLKGEGEVSEVFEVSYNPTRENSRI